TVGSSLGVIPPFFPGDHVRQCDLHLTFLRRNLTIMCFSKRGANQTADSFWRCENASKGGRASRAGLRYGWLVGCGSFSEAACSMRSRAVVRMGASSGVSQRAK